MEFAAGILQIVNTTDGERLEFRLSRGVPGLSACVIIARPSGEETLMLEPVAADSCRLRSAVAPQEPYEFGGVLTLTISDAVEAIHFHMGDAGHVH